MKRVAISVAIVVGIAGVARLAGAEGNPGNVLPVGTPPLFTQCPAIGLDTGCATLITITAGGTATTETDPNQPPYDGSDDQLIGVQNNFHAPICSITIASDADLFGFEGDGLCDATGAPPGCPFGPTGYEGPGTSFDVIDDSHGTVNFQPCIAPGKSAYFSLESSALGEVSFPSVNTGSSPAPAMGPLALGFLGAGLAVAGVVRARRRKAQ